MEQLKSMRELVREEGVGALRSFYSLRVGHPHCKHDNSHVCKQVLPSTPDS